MKKFALFFISLCIILSSCGGRNKDKDNSITYKGAKELNIVLLEELNLNATSDDPISFYSDNELVVTVNQNGVITGKNVGEANVTMSNTENSITVKVIVSLFEEPTFDFGINQQQIKNIYGEPDYKYGDSIYIYGSGNDWYSYAVWEMDFFFTDNMYYESDLYMRSDISTRLNEFLRSNYYINDTIIDTINDIITPCYIYLNEENIEDATVLLGKIDVAGPYQDICLFYVPYEYSRKIELKDIISRNRKRMTSN